MTLEEKFKSNVNGVIEKNHYGNGMLIPLFSKNFPFTTSHLLEIFQDIESTKDKMSKADTNLERSVAIQQGIEKMLTKCHKVYDQEKVSTAQTTLGKFFNKEIKYYNFQCFCFNLIC